jgi:hypothetical protein
VYLEEYMYISLLFVRWSHGIVIHTPGFNAVNRD